MDYVGHVVQMRKFAGELLEELFVRHETVQRLERELVAVVGVEGGSNQVGPVALALLDAAADRITHCITLLHAATDLLEALASGLLGSPTQVIAQSAITARPAQKDQAGRDPTYDALRRLIPADALVSRDLGALFLALTHGEGWAARPRERGFAAEDAIAFAFYLDVPGFEAAHHTNPAVDGAQIHADQPVVGFQFKSLDSERPSYVSGASMYRTIGEYCTKLRTYSQVGDRFRSASGGRFWASPAQHPSGRIATSLVVMLPKYGLTETQLQGITQVYADNMDVGIMFGTI